MTQLFATLVMFTMALCGLGGPAAAQEPPPVKLEQLLEVLSDPEVKAWVEAQTKALSAVPQPDAVLDGRMISHSLDMIRAHGERLINAFPALPAQFQRARDILLIEFDDEGPLVILTLIAAFIAGGLGCQRRTKLRPKGGAKSGHLWRTHETSGRA